MPAALMGRAKTKPRIGQVFSFRGGGITSRQEITVNIEIGSPGQGIKFIVSSSGSTSQTSLAAFRSKQPEISIDARASNVVNTLRNVVLGKDKARLCIVEHFLAAVSLWGLDDLVVRVDGLEMPFGDGSALFWIEFFERIGIEKQKVSPLIEIPSPIVVGDGNRTLMAIPDDHFSVTYLMDWPHPLIGRCWQTWDLNSDVLDVAQARTFGTIEQHTLLGIENVVSLTQDGFSQPLRFPDEPVRHKLLDLIGDLTLSGANPLSLKARFISIKGGHALDIEMASHLEPLVEKTRQRSKPRRGAVASAACERAEEARGPQPTERLKHD